MIQKYLKLFRNNEDVETGKIKLGLVIALSIMHMFNEEQVVSEF